MHEIKLKILRRICREADQAKLKSQLDPKRFLIESELNNLILDIKEASRADGQAKLGKQDREWIERLLTLKQTAGRSRETKLLNVLGLSRQQLQEIDQMCQMVEADTNFDRIKLGKCPVAKILEIRSMVKKAWERHIKTPLSDEERAEVDAQIHKELDHIKEEAAAYYAINKDLI